MAHRDGGDHTRHQEGRSLRGLDGGLRGAADDLAPAQTLDALVPGTDAFGVERDSEQIRAVRQVDVAVLLYQALGIERGDKQGRLRAYLRNLEFFGAPHAVFIFMPDWCDIREAVDVGMYAQNLMLAMQSHGLASCPQTILGYDADSVRRELDVEDDLKLLFGISFGYEDTSLPENQIVPDRAELHESVKFHE